MSYIALCFKSRSLECSSRFSYLSQNRFRAPLTDRKNSCGGRVGCVLKYSGAWYGIRRRRAKNAPAPSTPGNCRYYNYLFIPGPVYRLYRYENVGTRDTKKARCMMEQSTYANTRIESTNFMHYRIHAVPLAMRTLCVSLFQIGYRFTTHAKSECIRLFARSEHAAVFYFRTRLSGNLSVAHARVKTFFTTICNF